MFSTHKNSTQMEILASKIGSQDIISDGYLRGENGAMVFCVECKNELTGISSEPCVELVSYIVSSFKEQLKDEKYAPLFERQRVPALGMT